MISLRGVYERARQQLKRQQRLVALVRRVIRPGGVPVDSPVRPRGHWRGVACFWAGTVANRLQLYDAAARAFAQAVDLDPRYAGWWLRLGNVERLRGRCPEAIAAYERSLLLDSGSRRAHYWLAVCLNQPGPDPQLPTRGSRARREQRAIDAAFAEAHARVAELEPPFVFWLAVAERFRGNLDVAERLCEAAIGRQPGEPFWYQQLAEIRRLRLDWKGSVEAYERATMLVAAAAAGDDLPEPVPAPEPARPTEPADDPAAVSASPTPGDDVQILERIDDDGDELTLDDADDEADAEPEITALDLPDPDQFDLAELPEELDDAERFAVPGREREAERLTRATLPYRSELHGSAAAQQSYKVQQLAGPVDTWPAVVALYGAAAGSDELDPPRRYWLGVALHAVGDVREAIAAVEQAIDAAPAGSPLAADLASVLDRLVTWSGNADDWATAAVRSDQVLELEPAAARYFRAAIAYQRANRWRDSSDAFERGVALAGLSTSWLHRLGTARRQTGDWAGTAALYRRALELKDDPTFHFNLGFALSKLEEWPEAVAEYEAAIFRSRGRADWHFRLGMAHERTGSPVTAVHPRLGLVRTNECNLPAAVSAYERSIELDPTDARVWMRLGDARERLGRLEAARDAFAEAARLRPDDPQALHRYGRAVAAIGTQRGVLSHDEYDELERTWTKVLEIGPRHSGARLQLIRSSVRSGRWPVASRTAWFPEPPVVPAWTRTLRAAVEEEPTAERIAGLAEVLAMPDDELMIVPSDWWWVCHWRLLDARQFTLGFRAKELMAKRILAEPVRPVSENPGQMFERARALNFLDRHEEAIAALTLDPHTDVPLEVRWAADKLAADIRLVLGEVAPYRAFLALSERAVDRHAETAFRRLIEGKRVAIVGPAHTEADQRDEIDGHDVVIRTKYVKSTAGDDTSAGTRTDISYYALGTTRFLGHEIYDAVAEGDLQMAVFRTATYDPEVHFLHHPGDLRYPPSEYLGGLRSAQFAIQRIVYDVLRYNPASVKIFNINFFLSENPYRAGYLADYTKTYAEQGLVQALSAFGHDYRADFVFTQRMLAAGLVDVDPAVRELLQLTPEQYLAGLDTIGLG